MSRPFFPRFNGDWNSFFLARIEFDTNGGCWLWRSAISTGGYGRACLAAGQDLAHRVSWRAFRGEIPSGLWVLHRCDVPCCVNPGHLFLGTAAINSADMKAKGRASNRQGVLNQNATLTPDDIARIRQRMAKGDRQAAIARVFGVTDATICDIKKGRSWAFVP